MTDHPPLTVPGLDGATVLAEDPFAIVYRATQSAFGRPVAVKVLREPLDEDARLRFTEECRAAGVLSEHPAVVTLHDAAVDEAGFAHVVMELLTEGSLADVLQRQGALGWQEAVRVGLHVAHALAATHRTGVVHGDVRPGTVLVAADGTPLLAVFRVARVVGGEAERAARTPRSVVGIAPEVLDGAEPSVAADIYALGALLHELIAGDPPHLVAEGDSVDSVVRRITMAEPAPLNADTPDDVTALLARAMTRDPAARPASAAALGRELHALCRTHLLDLTDGRRWPEAEPSATAPSEPAATEPTPTPYRATHHIPWTGLPAWPTTNAGPEPVATLDPDLDVEVLEWSGDWARVRCSNDWEAWVDGRQLVPLWA